ncbi:MAG: filamentous hemagglutinin N-terminal domain-containing protein [Nitrospiraceae bacterium]
MTNSICHSNFIVWSIARSITNRFLPVYHGKPPFLLLGAIIIGLLQTALLVSTHAHAATSIIQTTGAGDLGTLVLPPNGHVYGITGGTPVGTNLYHSFAQFNVRTGDIAQFQTSTLIPNPAMHNILGRITDTNPSTIFGTIDSITYYPGANLFLMNPHGFLFGPNAMVNVGGMVAFTTADYLRLTDNIRFEAIPGAQDALLSTASVAAFGFLGSNSAAIAVQGSLLTVADGTGLSLIGGNQGFFYTNPDTGARASVPDGVTMTGGTLLAPGGQINLASVASAGEVLQGTLEPGPNINGNSFTAMGNISLSQGALMDVSANAAITAAGTVRIRGGQFVIADATLLANTANSDGALTALDIKVTGDLLISDTRGLSTLTARTTGDGDAGAIEIKSANLVAASTSPAPKPFALIDTHTSGAGTAGNITITTGNFQTSYLGPGLVWFSDSGTTGLGHGHGGNVSISAQSVTIEGTAISTGDTMASLRIQEANGSAGNVTIKGNGTINADSIVLLNSTIDTSAFIAFDSTQHQQAGSVTLNARDINLTSSVVDATGMDGGGAFSVIADRVILNGGSRLHSIVASGLGGGVLVDASVVELLNGSAIITTTFGDGHAGDIHVTATDHLTLSTSPLDSNPSGFFSNSTGDLGDGIGPAGTIMVTTSRLDMTGGSRINTITSGSGHGGDVTINSTNSVSISGEFPSDIPESEFGVGTIHPSGIFTGTAVGNVPCSSPCGDAGRILLTTGSLVLGNGAQIDSTTRTNGRGGDITISATNSISMFGTLLDGSPVGVFSRSIDNAPGSGSGGNISLTAGQSVAMNSGSSISASSTGPGNTGNIQIDAGNQFAMTNSSVTTEAAAASGGLIKITTNPSGTVQLTNSTISASVLDGTGGGGSVNIDPQSVILLNSQILAQAVQGPGGNIFITTNLLLPDANSVISASSQFGVNGTVTIQSPNAPASGQIQPLGKTPLQATSLLNQHCAALADGEFSSFTVAGRDSLPTEPDNWLASPLAMLSTGMGEGLSGLSGLSSLSGLSGVVRAGLAAHQIDQIDRTDQTDQIDKTLLSLRQIAPAGFLTQTFAVDWSASCQS